MARSSRAFSAACALLAALACTTLPLVAEATNSWRAKCSACRAVAAELVNKLEAEQPRNHLDMRHRLDKDGKRYGKVIPYEMSELRVIHLLEDLCGEMKAYELAGEQGSGLGLRWARTDELGAARGTNTEVTKQQRRELENFCHDLLERHEDELSVGLRGGKVDADSASDFLCRTTAALCEQTLEQEEAAQLAARQAEAEAAAAAAGPAEAEADGAGLEAQPDEPAGSAEAEAKQEL